MSVKFKGSQTEKNLLIAFAGESQARNRYTFFASQAKKEGLIQISDIFIETVLSYCITLTLLNVNAMH